MKKKIYVIFCMSTLQLVNAQLVPVVADYIPVTNESKYSANHIQGISNTSLANSTIEKELIRSELSRQSNDVSPEDLLVESVGTQVSDTPDKACEIVKQAISTSIADDKLIKRIIESAVIAAPDQLRLISQCAIAVAPQSLQVINNMIAAHDEAGANGKSGKETTGKVVTTGKETGKSVIAKVVQPALTDEEQIDVLRTTINGGAMIARRRLMPLIYHSPVISVRPASRNDVE